MQPYKPVNSSVFIKGRFWVPTAVDFLWCLLGHLARVVYLRRLVVDARRRTVVVEIASAVHGALKGIVLPAKEVIAMLSLESQF